MDNASIIEENSNTKKATITISVAEYNQLNSDTGRYYKILEFAGHTGNSGDKAFERFLFDLGRQKGFEQGVQAMEGR